MPRPVLFAVVIAACTVLATACSSDPAAVPDAGATIIDVRTPDEFAGGHLEGAINLSLEDGSLEAALANLDPAASYVVYCRSGRRSALAAQAMTAAGFTDVQDVGALDAAAATTGLAIVSG